MNTKLRKKSGLTAATKVETKKKLDAAVRRSLMECLETRVLLSSVAGTVWQDRNGDGVKDPIEPGLSGRTVYIDANDNGLLDTGERTAVSAGDGSYQFLSLPAGSYVLR